MTRLYCLKHQFGSEYGFVKVVDDSVTYVSRDDALIFDSLEEIEVIVDKYDLEVELVTFLIGKDV